MTELSSMASWQQTGLWTGAPKRPGESYYIKPTAASEFWGAGAAAAASPSGGAIVSRSGGALPRGRSGSGSRKPRRRGGQRPSSTLARPSGLLQPGVAALRTSGLLWAAGAAPAPGLQNTSVRILHPAAVLGDTAVHSKVIWRCLPSFQFSLLQQHTKTASVPQSRCASSLRSSLLLSSAPPPLHSSRRAQQAWQRAAVDRPAALRGLPYAMNHRPRSAAGHSAALRTDKPGLGVRGSHVGASSPARQLPRQR